jgi:hypothetical protein
VLKIHGFQFCSGLTSLNQLIPDSFRGAGEWKQLRFTPNCRISCLDGFADYDWLVAVEIPESVKVIGTGWVVGIRASKRLTGLHVSDHRLKFEFLIRSRLLQSMRLQIVSTCAL